MKSKVPSLEFETLHWSGGGSLVFGVDEAGRGCLAGPVCAGVSLWAPHSHFSGLVLDVTDSKEMSQKQREAAYPGILKLSLASGFGFASAAEIDRWNIVRATALAVARALEMALEHLPFRTEPDQVPIFLIDGNLPLISYAKDFVFHSDFEQQFPCARKILQKKFLENCVVKGDSKVFSIACASVLAKVSRDSRMLELDKNFPAYGFGTHKGYGTAKHLENLREAGPCIEHRLSFAPLSQEPKLFP